MTLDQFRPLAEKGLSPFVRAANALGLSPDGVSVIAFACAVAAGVAFGLAPPSEAPLSYVAGSAFVLANGWLDLVDGALARAQGTDSSGGDLLDHVLDRYADIAVLVGLAAGIGRYGLGLAAVTGVLMTSYLGTQIQAVGIGREYGGLLGRADRLALVGIVGVVAAAVPDPLVGGLGVVGLLLVVFAIVGHLTALQRFRGAWADIG
ncbi:CDP-alcohol phosphatidyltransferase family protein [Halobaculum sp. WSA2]|uniref:CDP-alcohol phosphatidyltransferase family protein n=1 Tax=Halobaculum saliterrae TaxID=2073113 RepID=A0A6B0SUT1_9EURY|nr:CDP-alcohol phosphatidyltransferase family protein [Halobaculum saliterrae]MXR42357.1 CDP-alcohol phosphatidyltransferase family protein [Halobaculum saliterrae]